MDPIMGSIMLVAFGFVPKGWMACNGQLVAVAQNAALFSLLGTAYGGDGINTFGLPDLRGRVPVGYGDGPGLPPVVLGEKAGTTAVTLSGANLPMHTHTATLQNTVAKLPASAAVGSLSDPSGAVPANATGAERGEANATFAPESAVTGALLPAPVSGSVVVGPAGNSLPVDIRTPYIGLQYVIAVEGIYPSRS